MWGISATWNCFCILLYHHSKTFFLFAIWLPKERKRSYQVVEVVTDFSVLMSVMFCSQQKSGGCPFMSSSQSFMLLVFLQRAAIEKVKRLLWSHTVKDLKPFGFYTPARKILINLYISWLNEQCTAALCFTATQSHKTLYKRLRRMSVWGGESRQGRVATKTSTVTQSIRLPNSALCYTCFCLGVPKLQLQPTEPNFSWISNAINVTVYTCAFDFCYKKFHLKV